MDVTITFDDLTDPPNIDAKNTTNTIDGNFEYTGRRSIQTSDLFTTLVTQPEWADEFGRIIFGDELQFVVNSSQLKLLDTTEQLNSVLERE